MTTTTITVEATLQPDGLTLQLEKKLALPPGRVTVTVQPTEPRTGPTILYRPRINQDPELKALVGKATELLVQEVLGPSGDMVSVEWDQAEDAEGRPVVTLTLSDLDGRVTATFDPSEFRDRRHMRFRLGRLWGDLLRIRSHKQLQNLLGPTAEVG